MSVINIPTATATGSSSTRFIAAFQGSITSPTMPDGDCMCVWVHRYALDGQWWLKFRNRWCTVLHD